MAFAGALDISDSGETLVFETAGPVRSGIGVGSAISVRSKTLGIGVKSAPVCIRSAVMTKLGVTDDTIVEPLGLACVALTGSFNEQGASPTRTGLPRRRASSA